MISQQINNLQIAMIQFRWGATDRVAGNDLSKQIFKR